MAYQFLRNSLIVSALVGCAGMKVIHPNDVNHNAGTMALDVTGGKIAIVETYSCKLESMGNRFTGVGKTEDEARREAVARCQDRTMLSFCKPEKAKCVKN